MERKQTETTQRMKSFATHRIQCCYEQILCYLHSVLNYLNQLLHFQQETF